jgi:prepilin-type N-terminal cleavage/methylation domain-containing protein/prepilin-type processing-associated H-X9-DG protein
MKKFTLIEVLVAVAIIGILASLLLPSLSKARKTSKGIVCKNRLKQLHLMSAMYSDDNDQYFLSWPSGVNNSDLLRWYKQFTIANRPYSLNSTERQMLYCPVFLETFPRAGNPSYITVSMSRSLIGEHSSKVSNQARQIIFGDGYRHNNANGTIGDHMNGQGRIGGIEMYIHDGKRNMIHVDGHVESNTLPYLSANQDLWKLD